MVLPIIEGFVTKIITGLDDAMVNTTILGAVAKTKAGKISFAVGRWLALIIIIVLSVVFAGFIGRFWWGRLLASGLLVLLAVFVYFDFLVHAPRMACCRYIACQLSLTKQIPLSKRITRGFAAGFLGFAATGVDEFIAYSSIMLKSFNVQLLIAGGILFADVLVLAIMYRFAPVVLRIPHKNIVTSAGLLGLAALVFTGVI